MDSQFHVAGEASKSWQKANEEQRFILHGSRQESVCRESPLCKTISSPETYSLSQEQHGKNPLSGFNYLPPYPAYNMWGLWKLQFMVRFGWGPSQTISHGLRSSEGRNKEIHGRSWITSTASGIPVQSSLNSMLSVYSTGQIIFPRAGGSLMNNASSLQPDSQSCSFFTHVRGEKTTELLTFNYCYFLVFFQKEKRKFYSSEDISPLWILVAYSSYKQNNTGWAWWLTPVIPALWEAKVSGSLEARCSRPAWQTW